MAFHFQIVGLVALNRFTRGPITQVQISLYFSALVPMLQRLLWLIIHFTERVLGIADSFSDDFQRFGHTLRSFVSFSA